MLQGMLQNKGADQFSNVDANMMHADNVLR